MVVETVVTVAALLLLATGLAVTATTEGFVDGLAVPLTTSDILFSQIPGSVAAVVLCARELKLHEKPS